MENKSKFTRLTFQDYYFLLTGKGEPVDNVFCENGRHAQLMWCIPIAFFGAPILGLIARLVMYLTHIDDIEWNGNGLAVNIGISWLFFGMISTIPLMMFFEWYDKRRHKQNLKNLIGNHDAIRKEAIEYMTIENIDNFYFVLQGRGNHQEKLPTFAYVLLLYRELFPNGSDKSIEAAILKRAAEVFDNKWFESERKLVEDIFPAHIIAKKELTID